MRNRRNMDSSPSVQFCCVLGRRGLTYARADVTCEVSGIEHTQANPTKVDRVANCRPSRR
jgi:hypothetical protein